jgi:hypothetical protein
MRAIEPAVNEENTMRVIVFVKATQNSEAGVLPSEKMLSEMGKFNEELVKAGIMQAGEGLRPSSSAKRVTIEGGKRSVIDGPFAEAKELVAGFWIWKVKSMDEAVEWARRCPDPMPGEQGVLELRPIYEMEDFGAQYTEELRQRDEKLRQQIPNR